MTDPRFTRDQLINRLSPLSTKLGITCRNVGDDQAVYVMPFRDDNTTIGNVIHGGAILSLADCAATGAAWSVIAEPERHRGLTIDVSLSFLSAARGADLTATARVVKRGGTICFCDVDITDSDGVPIARAKVTYKLSRKATPAETMGKVFADKSITEQAALLAQLERTGAALYRSFAEQTTDPGARKQLEDSALREEKNADALEQITWPQPQGKNT